MNYILEIKAFQDEVQLKQLSTGQIALWYALMYINNKCSWIEWFTVANRMLESNSGLSRQGVLVARNALKQYGYIDFKSNGTKATSYRLNPISKFVQADVQDSVQVSVQDSVQVYVQDSVQDCSTLNKQNETKQNETKKRKEKENSGVNTPTPTNKKKIKYKYGEYGWVMLTDTEHDHLIKEYGAAVVKHYIQYIDESAQQTGNKNKWKDWNLTIRKAIRNKWGGSYLDNFNNTEKNYDDDDDFLMG